MEYEAKLKEAHDLIREAGMSYAAVARMLGRDTISEQEYFRKVMRGQTVSNPVLDQVIERLAYADAA